MKTTILTILLLCYTVLSFGQKNPFIGGVFLGGNGIEVAGDQEKKWASGGWTGGLCVERYLAKRVSMQLELKYIQKGSIHPYLNDYGLMDWEVLRLDYAELPLVARVDLGKKKNVFFLEGGTALAYLFNLKYSETWVQNLPSPPSTDHYRTVDWSMLAGLGYRVNSGALNNFAFLFRFSRSLLPVNKLLEHYNVVYGVAATYYFRRG